MLGEEMGALQQVLVVFQEVVAPVLGRRGAALCACKARAEEEGGGGGADRWCLLVTDHSGSMGDTRSVTG